ncbi:MAG: tRNA (adenosine(37)-N6)-dimethylallyltransferase MiaA, partial [Halieaceae bacterium]|nr:tRNA (adenosine(37)-N6)-dimethylallyltransferase MiaA [Halieaceae bacterium]
MPCFATWRRRSEVVSVITADRPGPSLGWINWTNCFCAVVETVAEAFVDPRPVLICLMGPTASGKTDLAIQIAEKLDCELVSVDSALVYRSLDIGSAKPDYPHHLIDIRDPLDIYTAADFETDAHKLAKEISGRGKIPLLVGGTMLYFKVFLEGLAAMPATNRDVRQAIEREAAERGWPYIHAQLALVDPQSAARLHPNHSQRLSRALGVYRSSGITLTQWQRQQGQQARPEDHFRVIQLAICPADRAVLHHRISQRFEAMMAAGFLAEVAALRARSD